MFHEYERMSTVHMSMCDCDATHWALGTRTHRGSSRGPSSRGCPPQCTASCGPASSGRPAAACPGAYPPPWAWPGRSLPPPPCCPAQRRERERERERDTVKSSEREKTRWSRDGGVDRVRGNVMVMVFCSQLKRYWVWYPRSGSLPVFILE